MSNEKAHEEAVRCVRCLVREEKSANERLGIEARCDGIPIEPSLRCVAAMADWALVLREALKGLYEDQVDYLTINKLGGMDNHWMKAARAALSQEPKPAREAEFWATAPSPSDAPPRKP